MVAGRVRLGTSASISIYLLPPALRRFRDALPRVEIVIVTGNAADHAGRHPRVRRRWRDGGRCARPGARTLGLGRVASPLALGLVVVVLTYLSLVLGELVPRAIALRNPEGLAVVVARPIYALSRVSAGLVRVLTVSTKAVLRLMAIGATIESPFISEEDVRYLVREGAAKGIFEKAEEQLVHNVFEFADTTVREVMVPPPSIRGIDVTIPLAEVPKLVSRHRALSRPW